MNAPPGASLGTYTAMSPLLLVTAFSPAHQGGGAVIVRSLIGEYGRPEIIWASLATRDGPVAGRVAHRMSTRSAWLSRPRSLAQAINALADRHGASAVWIVAHGPILPAVAPLVRRYDRPVHLSVHDDPAWAVVFRTRRELPLTLWVHKALGDALSAASSVDVISSGMRADFARRFGIDSVVVHRVLEAPITPGPQFDHQTSGLSVGILGSVYARRQLEVLLGAVAQAAERADVKGRVIVIGGRDPELARRAATVPSVEVTFTGHLPEREGIAILRGAFALYLGYPFGLRARVLRRTSFPTKLATYLQAARPLLVHTPADSTLTPLLAESPYVIPWLDDTVESGAASLLRAWRTDALGLSQHASAELLRQRYFGAQNRTALFAELARLNSRGHRCHSDTLPTAWS